MDITTSFQTRMNRCTFAMVGLSATFVLLTVWSSKALSADATTVVYMLLSANAMSALTRFVS